MVLEQSKQLVEQIKKYRDFNSQVFAKYQDSKQTMHQNFLQFIGQVLLLNKSSTAPTPIDYKEQFRDNLRTIIDCKERQILTLKKKARLKCRQKLIQESQWQTKLLRTKLKLDELRLSLNGVQHILEGVGKSEEVARCLKLLSDTGSKKDVQKPKQDHPIYFHRKKILLELESISKCKQDLQERQNDLDMRRDKILSLQLECKYYNGED